MTSLASDSAFQTYAICVALLVIKMLISAAYTATRRFATSSYTNPEDARARQQQVSAQDSPAVARALRIQRNDLENIPLFFALGLVYVLMASPSPRAAAIYLWTFTISRFLHTIVYMAELQPFRALLWILGVATLIGMAVQVFLAI